MSLIPERHICPDCGGYDMTGMGKFGRNLKSVCRCEEKERADLEPPCLADARKLVAERAEQLGKPYSELKRTGTGGWL